MLNIHFMYTKICREPNLIGQGRVPRGSFSELNAFTYCASIVYAILCIDILGIFEKTSY